MTEVVSGKPLGSLLESQPLSQLKGPKGLTTRFADMFHRFKVSLSQVSCFPGS